MVNKIDFGPENAVRPFIWYRKFAYDNLKYVLNRIGVEKVDIYLNQIKKFCDLTDFEKKNGWYLPAVTKLRANVFDKYKPKSEISLFLKPIDSKMWDILVVIAGDYENPIKIEECVPRIYAKIDRKKLWAALQSLSEKADKEDWRYNGHPYRALQYYIESVYDRLEKECNEKPEGKNVFVVPKNDSDAMVFCTGLVTPDEDGAHYIYAYCSSPKDGVYHDIKWESHSGTRAKGLAQNPKLVFDDERVNHGLPYPPSWISNPERLLFDYRYGSITEQQIIFNFKHIYDNLYERVHESIRGQFYARFPPGKYKEKYEEFKTYIEDAWRTTRKILQKSFKVAIPTYYHGEIQLLVPLFLDEKNINQASAALVLTLNNKGSSHYFCPTCLSLEMARIDSRVITRIDDTWLKPDVKSLESMLQSSEGEEDADWWDCELEQCGLW